MQQSVVDQQEKETLEAVAVSLTQEEKLQQSLDEAKKISEFRLKTLSQLIGIHLDAFSAEMIATNGKSYKDKLLAAKALKEAVLFSIDFAVGVTKANIREEGTKLAKEVNGLAGVLVQAMDTRFLLIADNMKRQQDAEALAEQQTLTASTTEEVINEETKET